MGRFDDRVVLITGAARGMGEEEARRFVAEGAAVILGDVLVEEGEAAAADLGGQARFAKLDVTSTDDWDAAVGMAGREFGRLDVLVNNAGIAPITPIIGGSPEDYLKVVMVNQFGVYLGMRAAAPVMKAGERGGSIVNISSIDGLIGMPGVAGYVSSKFAVRGMTKTAALELAPFGIRVNSVHPGYIDTPMLREPMGGLADKLAGSVPLKRLGTTSDIANLVLFLASDESSYCTGSEFVIDGGVTAGMSPDVLQEGGTRRASGSPEAPASAPTGPRGLGAVPGRCSTRHARRRERVSTASPSGTITPPARRATCRTSRSSGGSSPSGWAGRVAVFSSCLCGTRC